MAYATEYINAPETAKLIRKALKKYFPGVKFSVRTQSYAGGASVYVGYTDGPLTGPVEEVVNGYKGATFDGQRDQMNYHSSVHPEDGRRVHYGAHFVFVRRELSDAATTTVQDAISAEWGVPFDMDANMGGEYGSDRFWRARGQFAFALDFARSGDFTRADY